MKKVFLKKAIVTLILVALLFSWCGSVSINVTFAESYSSDSTEEEKVYSSYTLEDNFKDDSVIVVIFHKDSALDDDIIYIDELPPSFNQLTFNDNTAELTATTITPNDPYYSDQYSLKLIDAGLINQYAARLIDSF